MTIILEVFSFFCRRFIFCSSVVAVLLRASHFFLLLSFYILSNLTSSLYAEQNKIVL